MKPTFRNTIYGVSLPKELYEKDFTETEISKAFGFSLRKLRTYKNLSLNALSEKVDIPNPTINRYENGINIPTITQAIKLTEFFNVSIEEMILFGIIDESGEKIIERCKQRENK